MSGASTPGRGDAGRSAHLLSARSGGPPRALSSPVLSPVIINAVKLHADELASALISDTDAVGMPVHGSRDAAVLIPIRDWTGRPEILFTERPDHLEKHAGEISFPGGKVESSDPSPRHTALRESHEEVGIDPAEVEILGALPPVGTFVTSFRIQPFVGLLSDEARPVPNPDEVAAILTIGIEELTKGYAMRRLVRRGVPIRTPTFEVERHLIWGATARILTDLLRRIGAL